MNRHSSRQKDLTAYVKHFRGKTYTLLSRIYSPSTIDFINAQRHDSVDDYYSNESIFIADAYNASYKFSSEILSGKLYIYYEYCKSNYPLRKHNTLS